MMKHKSAQRLALSALLLLMRSTQLSCTRSAAVPQITVSSGVLDFEADVSITKMARS